LIKGKHHAAMVDVGYNHKEFGGYLADKFGVINWHSPSEVLKECSLRPEDIDTVFVTHAHFDHFGNVDDFPKAKFYIQEREIAKWVWAMSLPERMQWMMVAIDPGDVLRGVQLAKNKRLVTVNGDLANVLPGIDLHPAYDSHTFGSMWVEVRNDGKSTSQDTWVLAGDLIYVYENLSGSGDVVGVEKIYNPVGLAVGSQMNLVLATEAMQSDSRARRAAQRGISFKNHEGRTSNQRDLPGRRRAFSRALASDKWRKKIFLCTPADKQFYTLCRTLF
jgi:N-acyl homoserine lactone hydrolase